ncbi:MAG: hypothetical protein AAF191_08705, partial [Verrucomicrobiota bacterium]
MAFRVDQALTHLRRACEQGRLAHAYLVTGSSEGDRMAFASGLVSSVSAGPERSLEEWEGEFVQVIRPESKSRRIRVEAMREVERRLHLSAPKKVRKIAVICDADRLMEQACGGTPDSVSGSDGQMGIRLYAP